MRTATYRRVLLATVAVLALVACGDDGDSSSTTEPTSTAPASTSSTSRTTTSSTGASTTAAPTSTTPPTTGTGCAGSGAVTPAGAVTKTVPDVDGDGKPDRGWIFTDPSGVTRFGIDTAAGRQSTMNVASGSPVMRAILVTNVDETGPVEILFSDGRQAKLFAYADCGIHDVTNPQGETYTFSLGFGDVGTGVGCVATSGGRRLVGLDVAAEDDDTVDWSRTVIELDGLHASNGVTSTGTYTRPDDDAAIDLLHQVTCGDLTMASDGIIERDG